MVVCALAASVVALTDRPEFLAISRSYVLVPVISSVTNQFRLSSLIDTSAGLLELMTILTCLVFALALALADAESEVLADTLVVLAKRSYSSWVRSCFQLPSSKTNWVKRSELEPSDKVIVR